MSGTGPSLSAQVAGLAAVLNRCSDGAGADAIVGGRAPKGRKRGWVLRSARCCCSAPAVISPADSCYRLWVSFWMPNQPAATSLSSEPGSKRGTSRPGWPTSRPHWNPRTVSSETIEAMLKTTAVSPGRCHPGRRSRPVARSRAAGPRALLRPATGRHREGLHRTQGVDAAEPAPRSSSRSRSAPMRRARRA